MSKDPRPGPPVTYAAYRVVLLCGLAVGLFVLGLVMFPGLIAVFELLVRAIENVLDFDWEPF